MGRQAGFLNQNLPILQQFRSGFSPEFDILDDQGRVVGMVAGTEGGARRFFLGPREFDVLDAGGSRLAHLSDIRDFWRDTYEIVRGDGSMLTTVARKVVFFSRRFSIALSTGEEFMVEGNFFDREFNAANVSGGGAAAQVNRERAGSAKVFLGHDRYALYHPPGIFPDRRLAILSSVIALDLMRAKDVRSAANNGA